MTKPYYWTNKEVALLCKMWPDPNCYLSDIEATIGRGRFGIRKKAQMLGIKPPKRRVRRQNNPHHKWHGRLAEDLRRLRARGLSFEAIANKINHQHNTQFNRNHIAGACFRLGLCQKSKGAA